MKYKTRTWLDAVVQLKGDTPFRMMDLPDGLRVRSEIKPLVADGILIETKREWMGGNRVPTWKVSSKYIASQKKKHIQAHADSRYLFDEKQKSVFSTVRARCYSTSNALHIEDAIWVGNVYIGDTYKVPGVLV